MCSPNNGATFVIFIMLRCLSVGCSNSWQAADKQSIAFEAVILNLNNGAVLHWAEFILTNRLWKREDSAVSVKTLFCPSHSPQLKDLFWTEGE